ncbi:MAG TPA: DsrE family protein [Parafilimonas sp.]|nr:DsrE family protein [Parafilimonas sp.]
MKKLFALLFTIIIFSSVHAQTNDDLLNKNRNFTGAVADKKDYYAIYQLDNNDPKVIEKALRNIQNALNDERLKGKVHIELIAFAGGTDAYFKDSKYGDQLKSLVEQGVIVAQCNNTLRERKISRDSIYNFIGVVPSANGELIIRQAQGWGVVKP